MPMPRQRPHRSKQDYATPWPFLTAVRDYLQIADFAIDLAASNENTAAPSYLCVEQDALSMDDWAAYTTDGWGWLNPPFTIIEPWARRCAATKRAGGSVAFLTPASVGANWFRDHVWGQAYILYLNGRLKFIPEQPTWLYPKDCMLSLFGPDLEPGSEIWTWKCTTPRRSAERHLKECV